MYRLHPEGVIRLDDGALIPADEGNADWQAYLAWVAAGGVAEPIPPPPPPTVAELLAPTDAGVARIGEDAIVALIGVLPGFRDALPAAALDKLNERRKLRGEAPV